MKKSTWGIQEPLIPYNSYTYHLLEVNLRFIKSPLLQKDISSLKTCLLTEGKRAANTDVSTQLTSFPIIVTLGMAKLYKTCILYYMHKYQPHSNGDLPDL